MPVESVGTTRRRTRDIEAVLVDEHARRHIEVALKGKPAYGDGLTL